MRNDYKIHTLTLIDEITYVYKYFTVSGNLKMGIPACKKSKLLTKWTVCNLSGKQCVSDGKQLAGNL